MASFTITSKAGVEMGTYDGETALHAYAAMLRDAGYAARVDRLAVVTDAPDGDQSDEMVIREACSEMINVTASNVRETSTGVRNGKDVDVVVTVNGDAIRGEVTLVPAPDGRAAYVAYGDDPTMWVSGALLRRLVNAYGDDLRDALREIEATASAEC